MPERSEIVPDTKDWTWVLERACPECGFDATDFSPHQVASEARYDEQDPVTVGREVVVAAERVARRFETVRGDEWDRPGYRSDGARFTIGTFALYVIHDPLHHVWDVGQART